MAELRQTLKIITEHGHSFENPNLKCQTLRPVGPIGTFWDLLGPVGTHCSQLGPAGTRF